MHWYHVSETKRKKIPIVKIAVINYDVHSYSKEENQCESIRQQIFLNTNAADGLQSDGPTKNTNDDRATRDHCERSLVFILNPM